MINKNKLSKYILLTLSVAALIILPVLFMISTSTRVIITGIEPEFFKAKTILLTGRVYLCLRDVKTYKTKKMALESREEEYTFAIISSRTISAIEIINEEEKKIPAENMSQVPINYLGNYSIMALGHNGFLKLGSGKDGLYGSIRFPNWGNGVWETLREVNISGNKVSFTRAITTQNELKRTGAQNYFTQKYSGEYIQDGAFIKGFYSVNAVRNPWEASRIK